MQAELADRQCEVGAGGSGDPATVLRALQARLEAEHTPRYRRLYPDPEAAVSLFLTQAEVTALAEFYTREHLLQAQEDKEENVLYQAAQ